MKNCQVDHSGGFGFTPSGLLCVTVSQEAGEGFTGPEKGEGGDSVAGDGESEMDDVFSLNHFVFVSITSFLLSGTAGAPTDRRETEL